MRRSLLLLVVAAGCGGKQKSTTPLPPLPEPKAEAPKPTEPVKDEAKAPEPPPGPLEVMLPSPKVTVKLVNAGKGKKAALKVTPKAGAKQQVELALDFRGKSTGAVGDTDDAIPTVVLTGEAEVKAVDKDGNADYQLTVSGTDARAAQGASMPIDQAKTVFASLQGLLIAGTVHPNGSASDLKLSMEKPQPITQGAIALVKMALPTLPVLPTEPIGAGAKWQVTSTVKLADQLDVTLTTDYELVSHKGNAWTIKAKTKVSGADQTIDMPPQTKDAAPAKATFSKINGKGSLDATLVDGSLYPTLKSELQAGFTVTLSAAGTAEGTLDMKQGATITPKQ